MTIETVSLSALIPSKTNPRKAMHGLEGLAASISTDGLLQNLVVKRVAGKGKRYEIVSGERRYRACKLLEERGALPEGFAVPVEIRNNLSKDDSLRIATVENVQRANLAPLEETAALTKLIHKGVTLEDVAAQTGLSPTTIRRSLVLNGLCREAKTALRGRTLTLSQAEALTLGNHEAQRRILEEIARGYGDFGAETIRETLTDDRPTVALAIFPLEQYTGTITTDLFAESETSYFDDAEQFFALQKDAVEALAASRRETAAWVEVTKGYAIADWQYRAAKKREASGVLINLSPSGRVEIREGLVKRDIDAQTLEDTADNPLAPRQSKAHYAAPLRRFIAHHKSAAVQEMLLSSPRKAKEIAAVRAILALDPHPCLRALSQDDQPQTAYIVVEGQARVYVRTLGVEIDNEESVWIQWPSMEDEVALYEKVKTLSDYQLDELHTLVSALRFGQKNCEALDTGDTLFNRVAQDLGVDMKNHWTPDRSFLERRNRSQLVAVAKACGYADGRSVIDGYKKAELVSGLLNHFAEAFAAETPSAAQAKAVAWLPEAMAFPAIDPDAPERSEGEQE